MYAEYFGDQKPARVFFSPAGWFGPFDIEFDCIALVKVGRVLNRIWLGTGLLVSASAVAYSTAGYFTRLIAPRLSGRCCSGAACLAACFCGVHDLAVVRRLGQRSVRWAGRACLMALCSAVATVCFLNAMRITAVADVMVIDAAIPFITAGLAWLILRERESWSTLGATAAALLGWRSMAGRRAGGRALAGRFSGLCHDRPDGVGDGADPAQARRQHAARRMPLDFALRADRVPFARPCRSTGRLFLLALFGQPVRPRPAAAQLGMRLVSAPACALIGALDTPLAPLWVWLAFGETPAGATIAGGLIVMAAVVGDIGLKQLKERSREQPSGGAPLDAIR